MLTFILPVSRTAAVPATACHAVRRPPPSAICTVNNDTVHTIVNAWLEDDLLILVVPQ